MLCEAKREHLGHIINLILPSSCDTWVTHDCPAQSTIKAAVQGRSDAGSLQCCRCWRRSWALCPVSGSLLCLLCGMSTDTRYPQLSQTLVGSNVSAHDTKDDEPQLLTDSL